MPTPEEKYEAFKREAEEKFNNARRDMRQKYEGFRQQAHEDAYATFVKRTEENYNDAQSKTNQDYEGFREQALKDAEAAKKTIEETKRDAQNAEYAAQMSNPDNWKEVKAEEAIPFPKDNDIGPMYAAPETGSVPPQVKQEEVVYAQFAPEMPTTGGYTPEYDAAIRGKDTKETVVEMQMAPEMPTTGGYTPEYDAAIRGKESELIGNKTVVYNENTITSVDQNGNGYGATVNNKGMLDYFVVKDGEKEPITAQNRGSIRENRTVELSKLNDIMIALFPESELSKAAIKTGKPYSLEVIQKDVRIITTPYNEGTVKEEAKASVERMKKAKESNTQGMSLRDRIATNRSNSGM